MGNFFVRRPIVAMVIAIFTVIVGVVFLGGLPTEQYPNITPPIVEVRATYTGANAVSVEWIGDRIRSGSPRLILTVEKEQQIVLREHGGIGFTFGRAGYATDIRLACHGLEKNDNDFVVGVLSHELYPASAVIQAMRKTKQTSQYLDSLGPFFIGKSIWQSKL